jgi:acyl carrier protein
MSNNKKLSKISIRHTLLTILGSIDGIERLDIDNYDFKVHLKYYGFNSINILKFLIEIEKTFKIEIGDENFNAKHFQTLESIFDYIKNKLK